MANPFDTVLGVQKFQNTLNKVNETDGLNRMSEREGPRLSLAYSPCPNDTFMFHALAQGFLKLPGVELDIHLHDIETLNQLALEGRYDITKISFHAHLFAQSQYQLLSTGAALGFGCGPIVVSSQPLNRDELDLSSLRVAVPGQYTTAHLLFRLWAKEAENKTFTTYDQIIPLVQSGKVDAGVIIHEGRFIYEQEGLHQIIDLGHWWESQTRCAIPLAGIFARKSLPHERARAFEDLLRQSIEMARKNPERALPYIREHAQEMDEKVLEEHIRTFVNDHSLGLSSADLDAIGTLDRMAREAGIL